VAHNSYVHTYTELGLFGGTMFVGAFYAALSGVRRLGRAAVVISDRAVKQWQPYVLAMTGAYCVGMYSLSRSYTMTTYLILGISAAYLHIAEHTASVRAMRFDSEFMQRLVLVGAAGVTALYLFVRLMARWN
jgi:O-antigen ligase